MSLIKTDYFDKFTITLWILLLIIGGCIYSIGLKGILDSRLYYTAEEALVYLTSLDSEKVSAYLNVNKFDFAFIFIYTMLLLTSLKKVLSAKKYYRVLGIIPGTLDLIETSAIRTYLKNPAQTYFFNWLGYVTFLKWISGALILLFFIISFLRQRRLQSSGNRS